MIVTEAVVINEAPKSARVRYYEPTRMNNTRVISSVMRPYNVRAVHRTMARADDMPAMTASGMPPATMR